MGNHEAVGSGILPFTKMQSCGNDYIYINCFDTTVSLPEALAIRLSDRHTGIGSDGVILILPPEKAEHADARMRMFNMDGSEGRMCGNAIRCVAKFLYDKGIINKTQLRIETKSGIREMALHISDGKVSSVQVDMGPAWLAPERIPVLLPGEQVVARPVTIGGEVYAITCVSMGNPHVVTFHEQVDALDLHKLGPLFEKDALFPDRVNVEFVEVVDRTHLKMRVWERGSGVTLACGTGACASVVAATLNGYCDKGAEVKVALPGGELSIRYTEDAVYMTGGCVTVFEGVVAQL